MLSFSALIILNQIQLPHTCKYANNTSHKHLCWISLLVFNATANTGSSKYALEW